jgi:hypothetical protein
MFDPPATVRLVLSCARILEPLIVLPDMHTAESFENVIQPPVIEDFARERRELPERLIVTGKGLLQKLQFEMEILDELLPITSMLIKPAKLVVLFKTTLEESNAKIAPELIMPFPTTAKVA